MNLYIVYMGTNTDSMTSSPPEDRAKFYVSFFCLLLKSTRNFVVVVNVKYVCKIMNLMLVTF